MVPVGACGGHWPWVLRKRTSALSETAIVMRFIHAAENAWPTRPRGPRETTGCNDGYRRLRNVTVPDDSAVETVNSQQPGSGRSKIDG
jgi:hypothetical protein